MHKISPNRPHTTMQRSEFMLSLEINASMKEAEDMLHDFQF